MEEPGFLTDTDKNICSVLLDVIIEKGVRDIVCCPGTRNAPLLISVAARDEVRKYHVIDERSAAFVALGLSLVSKRPVALICTSGTALLNFSPAIAEAYYQGIPLIVISADRPMQWIDQDDSQTIRQFEALSNFVKKSYELPAFGDNDKEILWYINRIANDAMIEATGRRMGPVHINVQLSEPLGRKREREYVQPRLIELLEPDGISNKEIIKKLGERIATSKVLFVAGFLQPDSRMHKSVAEFCSLPCVVPMTETLSNFHLNSDSCSVDSVLTAYDYTDIDSISPDIVVSVGGSLVSRKLKEYLRRNSSHCEHWALGWNHTTSDCFMSLTKRIECDTARFLHQLAIAARKRLSQNRADCTPSFSDIWKNAREKALSLKSNFADAAPWSELKAFDIINRMMPENVNLFLSNGTTVRYAQILSRRLPHASYGTRGVSGIDGSTSTAVGGSVIYKGTTLLITGDMSMSYDIGALSLGIVPDRMKIIVMDNGGGGIFRFINTTSSLEEREEYFCCAPILPLKELSAGYGWSYYEASDESSLVETLPCFFSSPKKSILKIVCDGEESASLLREYMKLRFPAGSL